MLRIKKNVDLKELEKFGLERKRARKGKNVAMYKYIKQDEYNYKYVMIAIFDREIHASDLDVVYDLIKADLVEKVEE